MAVAKCAARSAGVLMLLACGLQACGGGHARVAPAYPSADPHDAAPPATAPLQVRWTLPLIPPFSGRYIPVERGGAVADMQRGLVFATSSDGRLWTLGPDGKKLRHHDMGAPIEVPPVYDSASDTVWAVAITGQIQAVAGRTGEVRWTVDVGEPVSTPVQLSDDAIYLVTDNDMVVAISRADGDLLWRRPAELDAVSELSIAGQAGLLLTDGMVFTGRTDGRIVALDASDGRELWHVDTALDLDTQSEPSRFHDVDTRPVLVGERLYVASFAAGLYVLDPMTGEVLDRHAGFTGVTSIGADNHSLVLASAEQGLICLDINSMTQRWTRAPERIRGAMGTPQVVDGQVFVGESLGALFVLDLGDGHEMARLESAHGYTAAPHLGDHRVGFILSNAAELLTFVY